jgi:hypothetical protein
MVCLVRVTGCGLGASRGPEEESKRFFFRIKEAKNFYALAAELASILSRKIKSFLVLFAKKNTLPAFASLMPG